MRAHIRLALVLLLVSVAGVFAIDKAVVFSGSDAAPAFIVFNNHATSNLVVTITSSGAGADCSVKAYSVAGKGVVTTIDGSGRIDTIAEFVAAVKAATNFSTCGIVDDACSLSSDSSDAELLSGIYTAAPGGSVSIPWDTSACLFYDVYAPSRLFDGGKFIATHLKGAPAGTGDVTLTGYLNGSVVWGPKTYTSPIYTTPATMLTPSRSGNTEVAAMTTNYLTDNRVWIDEELNIPVPARRCIMFRAARGTTTTIGGLTLSLIKN